MNHEDASASKLSLQNPIIATAEGCRCLHDGAWRIRLP